RAVDEGRQKPVAAVVALQGGQALQLVRGQPRVNRAVEVFGPLLGAYPLGDLSGPALAHPVDDHAGLRERERAEDAERVEGQHRLLRPLEDDDEYRREDGEDDDAVGEDEAVATVGELARQKPVSREQGGEAREVGERGG